MPFLDEVAAKLVADGVGALGTSIFMSTKAVIPTGAGPYLTLVETGGAGPGGFRGTGGRTQNVAGVATQHPGAQVACRASSYPAARAMAKAAYLSLDGIWNTTLSGTFYLSLTARQEPTDLGLDEAGRAMVVFNIDAEKEPS
ncbi:MAG: minor capsid protein [Sulfuricaulis sp.]|nr:minor capsid protein [Sulfuricaulis sp.]